MSTRWRSEIGVAAAGGLMLAALLAGAPGARGQEPAPAPAPAPEAAAAEPEEPLIDPEAVEPVQRMVATLTGAKQLSFTVEQSYDVIQADGEAIEFGSRSEQTIRRPDRMRVERWDRTGRHLQAFYDGRAVTVYDDGPNVYASAERSGTLDQLTDFLRDDVGLRLPLADLFGEDLAQVLVDNVIAARHVDVQTVEDRPCDHVALRTREGVGIQLWIRQGDPAVPERIVINFELARGRPQFRASFTDWNLSPRTPDRLFAFEAPRGATRVPFVLPERGAAASAAQEGGQ
ncbi:MAG: DUF2092 domain-containing protein [Deltaproteobacteria bacterium]|nr:DUF2092 domain-containing protein [Deltaproteobacteria bacterium]